MDSNADCQPGSQINDRGQKHVADQNRNLTPAVFVPTETLLTQDEADANPALSSIPGTHFLGNWLSDRQNPNMTNAFGHQILGTTESHPKSSLENGQVDSYEDKQPQKFQVLNKPKVQLPAKDPETCASTISVAQQMARFPTGVVEICQAVLLVLVSCFRNHVTL
ncbi:hypothetical protein PoB_002923200 [Plakobranchus ocellatus]|uniref:Uncharacterized protein n=1 Tax=Plakobranchus ocellatus TaxID=259542 RepID=A0AAV4A7A3_9GAST|nr:hypothetical protein PoB_002923200 [Plakobranchus ocellatus]